MKVNPKINNEVKASVEECRNKITKATIELLKKIGANQGEDVVFGRTLFLVQTKDNVSETIVADRISYADTENCFKGSFYCISFDGEYTRSNLFLSLSNLMIVYKEVLRVVRKY